MRIALAQTRYPSDGDIIAMVERYAQQADAQGADLLVFPECLMTPFGLSPEEFAAASQPLDGQFCTAVSHISRSYNLWILHTANEFNPEGKPFNTAVLLDDKGSQTAVYRKVHLFDAGLNRESLKMSAGSCLQAPVETPFGALAFAICYDLRFPEVARKAALQGADCMIFPSAWVDGPGKVHAWKTLLTARAIENEMYVAGLSSCDDGRIGRSMVVAPDGSVVAEAGAAEELLVCDLDLERVSEVRQSLPVFEHRRPELYDLQNHHLIIN